VVIAAACEKTGIFLGVDESIRVSIAFANPLLPEEHIAAEVVDYLEHICWWPVV